MRSRFAVVGIFSALLLTGCGSGDACDRPMPYVTSTEGGELVVPEGLSPPPASSQKRIPKIADERRERSNPCSVGPPDLLIESTSDGDTAVESTVNNSDRSPPSPAAPVVPVDVGPLFKSDSVEDTVAAWIASWSAGDAPSYLSFYASDFASNDESVDRDSWLRKRQQLVKDTGPASISIRDVTIEDLPAGRKMVRLIQDFRSSDGQDASVVKLLEMVWEYDSWRIRRERVVEVLPADGAE